MNFQNRILSQGIRFLAWGSVVVLLFVTYVFLMSGAALNRDANHESKLHDDSDSVLQEDSLLNEIRTIPKTEQAGGVNEGSAGAPPS